ncbi:hypothetical protein GC207_05030 [bacterium]|nr:hypothetical protein [bacterium]
MKALRSTKSFALAAILIAVVWKCANLASLEMPGTDPIISLGKPVRTKTSTGSATISIAITNQADVPVAIQAWSEDVWELAYFNSPPTNNTNNGGLLAPHKNVILKIPEADYAAAPKENIHVWATPAASRQQQVKDHVARVLQTSLRVKIPSWRLYVKHYTPSGWILLDDKRSMVTVSENVVRYQPFETALTSIATPTATD